MKNLNRFDEMNDNNPEPEGCLVCQAMLPDAVDGTLTEAEGKAFDKHVAGCVACTEELAEAQRGAAWLHMLKGHTPEPSATLLTKILAQTTGAQTQKPAASNVVMMPAEVVARPALISERPALISESMMAAKSGGVLLAFKQKVVKAFTLDGSQYFQPRLAMTAAMAFFSVALTLNMTGVKLTNLKAADFKPSSLRRTVAETGASMTRSFHGLRVVNQFESKLEDLKTNEDERSTPYVRPSAAQPPTAAPQPKNNTGNDTNDDQQPKGHSQVVMPAVTTEAPLQEGM